MSGFKSIEEAAAWAAKRAPEPMQIRKRKDGTGGFQLIRPGYEDHYDRHFVTVAHITISRELVLAEQPESVECGGEAPPVIVKTLEDFIGSPSAREPVATVDHVGSSYGKSANDTTVIVCKGADTNQLVRGTKLYADSTAPAATFQDGVSEWMAKCFIPSLYSNMTERGDRLAEEVIELLQSHGYDKRRIATLVEHVYSKPVGDPAQEVGGVMVTLAGYCWIAGLDMHAAGDAELARINRPEVMEKIRAKQELKNAMHFDTPLPGGASAKVACIWPDCGHDTNCVGYSPGCTGMGCPAKAAAPAAPAVVVDEAMVERRARAFLAREYEKDGCNAYGADLRDSVILDKDSARAVRAIAAALKGDV